MRIPGNSRTAVDRDALVRLLEEVEVGRDGGLRHPLAAALSVVSEAPEMRPLRQPNHTASELRREYQDSTGAERMLAAAALQRAAGLFAGAGRAARA